MDFRDRHVVVTGGTGALGRAVVGALLAAGAHCHVPYRQEREKEGLPTGALSLIRIRQPKVQKRAGPWLRMREKAAG